MFLLLLLRLTRWINAITASGKKKKKARLIGPREPDGSLISALIILLTSHHIDYADMGSYGIRDGTDTGSTSDGAEWLVTGGLVSHYGSPGSTQQTGKVNVKSEQLASV